jgi:hypothetical protein
MLFSRLRYLAYALASKRHLHFGSHYASSLMTGETLQVLKNRLKHNEPLEKITESNLDTTHLNIGNSLLEVLGRYKKPKMLNRQKVGGIKHDLLLYKRFINGLKSRVLYNFVNENIASVTFQISLSIPQHLAVINQFIANNYLDGEFPENSNHFAIVDAKGNKLIYEYAFDVKLTYVNNNAEIIQNVNVALYHDRYSSEKYIDSSKFQLSI